MIIFVPNFPGPTFFPALRLFWRLDYSCCCVRHKGIASLPLKIWLQHLWMTPLVTMLAIVPECSHKKEGLTST